MRRLTILVIGLALIYSAYWFIGERTVTSRTQQTIAALRQDGWQVDHGTIDTRGYPSRFDTTFEDINVTTPDGRISYQAAFVQAFALSYQPNRVIMAFADRQTLRLDDQTIALTTQGLRASGAVAANAALSLDNITAESGPARLMSDAGWSLSFESALIALRENTGAPHTYDVYVTVTDAGLPDIWQTALDPEGIHPAKVATLTLDMTLTLDRPLDQTTLAMFDVDPPLLTALSLRALTLRWGDMAITGRGDLAIDATGIPTGEIVFGATGWRDMIHAAGHAGLIAQGFDRTITNFATILSAGNADLDLTLGFAEGRMSLGPIPLGPAPRLH